MFRRPSQAQPAGAEGAPQPPQPTLLLPEELRAALEASLGHPVPRELTKEQAGALIREVATKAPVLHRPLTDLFLERYQEKVKNKPAPKTARPPAPMGWFYVRDSEGNWVPSRGRYLGTMLGATTLFFVLIYLSFASPGGKKAPPPQEAAFPTPTVETLPAPPESSQKPPSSPDPQSGGAQNPSSPTLPSPTPPSNPPEVLPPPPADVPPPPDYEGAPQAGGGQSPEGPTVVLYKREASPATEATPILASAGRPAQEMAVTQAAPPSEAKAQEAEGGGGPFWSRPKGEEASPSPLIWGRAKEGEAPTPGIEGGHWQRKPPAEGPTGQEGEPIKPQGKGVQEMQVVWTREGTGENQGGIIPPSASPSLPAQPASPPPSSSEGRPPTQGGGTP